MDGELSGPGPGARDDAVCRLRLYQQRAADACTEEKSDACAYQESPGHFFLFAKGKNGADDQAEQTRQTACGAEGDDNGSGTSLGRRNNSQQSSKRHDYQ